MDAKINGQHTITEIILLGILGPLVSVVHFWSKKKPLEHCTGSPVIIPTKIGCNLPSGFTEDWNVKVHGW